MKTEENGGQSQRKGCGPFRDGHGNGRRQKRRRGGLAAGVARARRGRRPDEAGPDRLRPGRQCVVAAGGGVRLAAPDLEFSLRRRVSTPARANAN